MTPEDALRYAEALADRLWDRRQARKERGIERADVRQSALEGYYRAASMGLGERRTRQEMRVTVRELLAQEKWRPTRRATCRRCGGEITRPRAYGYCSMRCRRAARREQSKTWPKKDQRAYMAAYNARRRAARGPKACRWCGGEVAGAHAWYCSPRCRHAALLDGVRRASRKYRKTATYRRYYERRKEERKRRTRAA